LEISGLDEADTVAGAKVFQAGTAALEDKTVTSGGRVLGVTGLGATLAEAKAKAYEAVAKVHFEGQYFRRDIGDKGIARTSKP
jgi:phosphoribosylamine--glycine ligase